MKAGFLIPVLALNTVMAAAAPDPAAPAFDAGRALDASQAVIGSAIGDHRLTAPDGRTVSLAGFRGRPLVIKPDLHLLLPRRSQNFMYRWWLALAWRLGWM